MGRSIRLFGSAPYLGQDQELDLGVRFAERRLLKVEFDGVSRITVDADITGHDDKSSLVTDTLDELRRLFEEANFEPPTRLLVMTWEKVLNETWARALL